MPLSLKTALTVRHLEKNSNLGPTAKRQPFAEGEKAATELSKAIDEFFPSIDETIQDGALGKPGLVRYHQKDGEQVARVSVEYNGNSTEGRYLQEWVGGGYLFTEFSEDSVDHFGIGPQGASHLHLDREEPSKSYIETVGAEWKLFGSPPSADAPPEMPENSVTTESGLEYGVLQEGHGPVAHKGRAVLVHYSGWLEDGTKFDTSRDRQDPFEFTVGAGKVIKGWDEGVEGMKVGEKRLLKIPSELGYGERGAPPTIPANAPLIFEVELLATPESL